MNRNKGITALSYVLTALLACVATLLAVMGIARADYSKLDQLTALIEDRFIGEVSREELADAAADAMVGALGDRWSYYIPAEEYEAYKEQMSNSYVGIGVTIQQRTDGQGLDVMEVTAGGPAEAAGMLAGDRIVSVEGQSILGMEINRVREKIRGQEGTKVSLTVLREGQEIASTLTRQSFRTPVATAVMLDGGVGLVTVENFDARCAQETLAAIEQLRSQGAQKLIFDVRNNPGGYKTELVKVLDALLPEGLIFRSEYYDGKIQEDMSDKNQLDIPMAVLVNENSYSAAEFFAVALKEYDKAIVVGNQTVGKGYFQSVFPLDDGSAVGLSIGKYYTPKGISLEGVGITPDYEVAVDEQTASAIYYGTLEPMKDPQILKALEVLAGG